MRENDAFDKERTEWKKTASKSFQNKRARSLSRSRLKNMTHGRKNSTEDQELVTSFGVLAFSRRKQRVQQSGLLLIVL